MRARVRVPSLLSTGTNPSARPAPTVWPALTHVDAAEASRFFFEISSVFPLFKSLLNISPRSS